MLKIDFLVERANDDLMQVFNKANEVDDFTKNMEKIYSYNGTNKKFVPKRNYFIDIQKNISECGEIIDFFNSFAHDKFRFENKDSQFIQDEINKAVQSIWGRFVFKSQDLLADNGELAIEPESVNIKYSAFSNVSYSDYPIYLLFTFCYGISEVSIPPYSIGGVIGENPANTEITFVTPRSDLTAQINSIPGGVYSSLKLQICLEVSSEDVFDIEYIAITDIDKYAYVWENKIQLTSLSDETATAEQWNVGDEIRIISSISKKMFRTHIQSIDTTLHQITLTDTTPWKKTQNEDGQYGEICSLQKITGAARYFKLLNEEALPSNITIV